MDDCLKIHVSDYLIYKSLKTYVYKFPYFIFRKKNTSYIVVDNHKYDNKLSEQGYKIINVLKRYKNKETRKTNQHRNKTRKNKI